MNGCNPTPDKFDINGPPAPRPGPEPGPEPGPSRGSSPHLDRTSFPSPRLFPFRLCDLFPLSTFFSIESNGSRSTASSPFSFSFPPSRRGTGPKEKKEERIDREGRGTKSRTIGLAVFIRRYEPAGGDARVPLFYRRVGRERRVWLKFHRCLLLPPTSQRRELQRTRATRPIRDADAGNSRPIGRTTPTNDTDETILDARTVYRAVASRRCEQSGNTSDPSIATRKGSIFGMAPVAFRG